MSFWNNFWHFSIQVKDIFYLIAILLALYVLYNIVMMILKSSKRNQLKLAAQRFRNERDEKLNSFKIPKPQLDPRKVEEILNSDVTGLKQMLASSAVTSVDLVNIFSNVVQQFGIEYGIVTHLKYEEAIQQAKECDEKRKSGHNDAKGLLFGIPISIKETFDEKGYPSTVGCINRINYCPKEDGTTVKLLKRAGAIPFMRTNVPQTAMTFESMNEIYGRVQNPWNRSKFAGGSSGGEGAAIAARMSPLGIGSDIGGSIRIPAAMCGVFGFKPTSYRSVMSGHTFYSAGFGGQTTVPACAGPIGKSVDDLILMFRSLSDPTVLSQLKRSELDSNMCRYPINETALKNQKANRKFGYFKTLDILTATPPCQRAVELVVDELKKAGHQLIEVQLPSQDEIVQSFLKIFFSDKLHSIYDLLQGEELAEEYKMIELSASLPKGLKSIIGKILGCSKQQRLQQSLKCSNELSSHEYRETTFNVQVLQKKVLQVFDDLQIEAIICPAFGSPALSHGSSKDIVDLAMYTFIWNVLNFPAGVVPVTIVKEDEQYYSSPIKDLISEKIDQQMKKDTAQLPVGVQIVTPTFEEENCLNVMKLVDSLTKFYQKNHFPPLI